MSTTCVYTAVIGGYDELIEPDVAAASTSDFICFTDDPGLRSDVWHMRLVEPAFAHDSVRSARMLKILGHSSLDQYDATLYIDASVVLRKAPEEILAQWLPGDVDLALAIHSFRGVLLDEFDEVVRLNYDDRARVYEQLADYAVAHPEVLESQTMWTGMLARRPGAPVARAMRTSADHVLRYSRRDQLSVLVALATPGLRYRAIELDNFASDVHQWPVTGRRQVSVGRAAPLMPGPLVVEVRRAWRAAEQAAAEAAEQAARAAEEHRAQIEALSATQQAVQSSLDDARRDADGLRARLARAESIRGSAANLRAALRRRLRRRRVRR